MVGCQVEFHGTKLDVMKRVLGNLIKKDLRIFNVEPNIWYVSLAYALLDALKIRMTPCHIKRDRNGSVILQSGFGSRVSLVILLICSTCISQPRESSFL